MKKMNIPEMEVVCFDAQDVIATSGAPTITPVKPNSDHVLFNYADSGSVHGDLYLQEFDLGFSNTGFYDPSFDSNAESGLWYHQVGSGWEVCTDLGHQAYVNSKFQSGQ